MAKKDTIAALTKRGINEETATVLVSKYGSMSKISEQGVEGLVASGLDEENAKIVINAIGKAPSRSSSSGSRKASSSSASAESAPAVSYELVEKGYDMSDLAQELSSIGEAKGIVLPPKIYNDIAKKISNADPAIITPEVREKLVVTASRMFESHRMVQNESAGIMAAHSIGEPGTQMNLRTFHFAGDSFVSVTKGLPRLIEIVDAHAAPLTPSMTVPLLGLAKHDEGVAKHIVSEIAVTVLENVADIETDLTNVCLVIKPRPDTIQDKGITVDEIVESLSKVKALKGSVRQEGFNIVVSATEDGGYRKLQQMFDAARKAKIKGIDGIKQAFIKKDGEGADAEYSIITDGSNLKEILKVPYVDAVNVMTNSICEIEQVLGIEAARNAIVKEAYGTLEEAGLNIDIRHIMMVADLMTNDGTVRSIGRNGISGTKSSVLSRAAFEITAMHLLHAAIVGEVDNLNGVTENIIVGQPVALGTGAVNLSYAPEKIRGIKRPDVGTDAGIDAVADDDADMDAGATMGGDQ